LLHQITHTHTHTHTHTNKYNREYGLRAHSGKNLQHQTKSHLLFLQFSKKNTESQCEGTWDREKENTFYDHLIKIKHGGVFFLSSVKTQKFLWINASFHFTRQGVNLFNYATDSSILL